MTKNVKILQFLLFSIDSLTNTLDFCFGWFQMSPQTRGINLILTELIATNMYKIALICSPILFTNLCTHAHTHTHLVQPPK